MIFGTPWNLLFLLLLPALFFVLRSKHSYVVFPSIRPMSQIPFHWSDGLRYLPAILRYGALVLIVIALARPQATSVHQERLSEGLDIVLVIDTSKSMEARDLELKGNRPTRLDVVKKVIVDFISQRPSDRIGLVIFGTEAFTQAPLTLDHDILLKFLTKVSIGMAGDATAIGDGLATAVNRLKKVGAKSKIVILLTDGANTAGRVDPLAAADAAASKGVTVYTIGVGGEVADQDTGRPGTMEIDEKLLKEISTRTGGQSFLATNREALTQVYSQIDNMEKTKAKVKSYQQFEDLFPWFLGVALLMLLSEMLVGLTRVRSIP